MADGHKRSHSWRFGSDVADNLLRGYTFRDLFGKICESLDEKQGTYNGYIEVLKPEGFVEIKALQR